MDGEGCFLIVPINRNNKIYFNFRFLINLHKDDLFMLQTINKKLKEGSVYVGNHFAQYIVTNKKDLLTIFKIFDNTPLNTTKNLNYLVFKKAYILWCTKNEKIIKLDLVRDILELKNSMNRKRISYEQPSDHKIIITPYWLLGLIEGEGYFCLKKNNKGQLKGLEFGIGQTESEYLVLKAVKEFLLNLPGSYILRRDESKAVKYYLDKKAKNIRSKLMTRVTVNDFNYIKNVLVPFLDELTWFSKKEQDYEDWKIILSFISQGKHFINEGQELILFINKIMNNRRLSTNIPFILPNNIEDRIQKLLEAPSNYKIHDNGKIFIISQGKYFKGRGNVKLEISNFDGLLINTFNSIKNCAQFFQVSQRTIIRRLDSGNVFVFKDQNFFIKRTLNEWDSKI